MTATAVAAFLTATGVIGGTPRAATFATATAVIGRATRRVATVGTATVGTATAADWIFEQFMGFKFALTQSNDDARALFDLLIHALSLTSTMR